MNKETSIKPSAFVFDAYGTLFDVNSAAAHCKDELGDKWETLAEIWRTKQLNYTWLRSLMGEYIDFYEITRDSLDYAMKAVQINDRRLMTRLLKLYETLDSYPEVINVLQKLKTNGMQTAILSNGTMRMLTSAAKSSGIINLIDQIISVEELGVYKPHQNVYKLAVEKLDVDPDQVCFMSSNGWDASGAAIFGFKVIWVNRFNQAKEYLPGDFYAEISSLEHLNSLIVLN